MGSGPLARALSLVVWATLASTSIQVSDGGHGAYEASLIPVGDGFAVAWHDTRHGRPEIYMRLVGADGRPAGPEHRLTTSADRSYEPSLDVVGDDLVVAWYDVSARDAGLSAARVGVWAPDGTPRWTRTLSDAGRDGRIPVVRTRTGQLFCAWLEDDGEAVGVWAQWLDDGGTPVDAPRRIAEAGPTTWNLNAALDADGVAWVVFDAVAGTRTNELFVARVGDADSVVTRVTDDDGVASTYPALAFGGRRAALTWFDERAGNREVYLSIGAPDVLRGGVEAAARRITHTPGESIGAYVAWNGAAFGLAWSDELDGQQHEVHFQAFDTHGEPAHDARRITDNPTASLIPSIRRSDNGFALAWNEDVIAARGDHVSGGRSDIVFAFVP